MTFLIDEALGRVTFLNDDADEMLALEVDRTEALEEFLGADDDEMGLML